MAVCLQGRRRTNAGWCWSLLNQVEVQIPKYLKTGQTNSILYLIRPDIFERWIRSKWWFTDSDCQSSGLVSQHDQHDFKTLLKVLEIWPESWLDYLAVSWCCANGAHSTAFGHWTEVIARRLCTWPLKWSHLSYVSVANLRSHSCSSSLSRLLSSPLPLEFIRVRFAQHCIPLLNSDGCCSTVPKRWWFGPQRFGAPQQLFGSSRGKLIQISLSKGFTFPIQQASTNHSSA